MTVVRFALLSLTLAPLLACSNSGAPACAEGYPLAVEAIVRAPELNADELASMDPDGSVVRLCARLDALEYFIVDANPTDYSWRGLRLARDDDTLHGEAIWMVFGEGFTPGVRVDPAIGAIAELPTVDGRTTIDVAANPDQHEGQAGWIVLEGSWGLREGWREPALVVTRSWRGTPPRCGMIPGGHPTLR